MELNEREKTIVDLINRLADVADEETTTQTAIDNILASIRHESEENMREDMERAEQEPEPTVEDVVEESEQEVQDMNEEGGHHCTCGHNHEKNEIPRYMYKFLFTRIREVKKPEKAHPTDAGIDFFVPEAKAWDVDFRNKVIEYSRNSVPSCPNEGVEFVDSSLVVHPRAHVAIPSGIKTIIPAGFAMMMVNKSGVATKMKLDHSACLIDSEYRDELIFCFFNHNVEPVKIEPGMKLTQGLIVPVINLDIQEVLNCVYDDIGRETDRGGGFGSSGSH